MRKLSCKEAGMMDCDYEASGESDDDVVAKAREHARTAHDHELTADEEKRVRSIIKNV